MNSMVQVRYLFHFSTMVTAVPRLKHGEGLLRQNNETWTYPTSNLGREYVIMSPWTGFAKEACALLQFGNSFRNSSPTAVLHAMLRSIIVMQSLWYFAHKILHSSVKKPTWSNFSYCPVTWIFCGKKNCAKLEKLQERALRIVFNDGHASYETLYESANILPLNVYRVRVLGIEVYKCVNGLNPKYINDMLVIRPNADRLRDSSRAIYNRSSARLVLGSNLLNTLGLNYGMYSPSL